MKRIEIYTVGFSAPTLVAECEQKKLAGVLEAHDLLGKCVMLRTVGDLHDSDTVEPVEPATAGRRPTFDELAVGTPVMVRGFDEMVTDAVLHENGDIEFLGDPNWFYVFVNEMKKFCGNTYKVTKKDLKSVELDCGHHWSFTPQMLTYIAPEASK